MNFRFQATVLTGEGGRLRRDLEKGKDYEVVPEAIWKALSAWYGGNPALPRQVTNIFHNKTHYNFVVNKDLSFLLGCSIH